MYNNDDDDNENGVWGGNKEKEEEDRKNVFIKKLTFLQYLLSGSVPTALYILTNLILSTILWDKYYYCSILQMRREQDPERLSDLPGVSQGVSGSAGIHTQVVSLQSL